MRCSFRDTFADADRRSPRHGTRRSRDRHHARQRRQPEGPRPRQPEHDPLELSNRDTELNVYEGGRRGRPPGSARLCSLCSAACCSPTGVSEPAERRGGPRTFLIPVHHDREPGRLRSWSLSRRVLRGLGRDCAFGARWFVRVRVRGFRWRRRFASGVAVACCRTRAACGAVYRHSHGGGGDLGAAHGRGYRVVACQWLDGRLRIGALLFRDGARVDQPRCPSHGRDQCNASGRLRPCSR